MSATDAKSRKRSAGVLLHPTSLPGPFGIGDLGPVAYEWIDALVRTSQTWWQVLPLGPTGFGDSPYQAFSAFAGNTNLLSPELLVSDGLLAQHDLGSHQFPADHVEFGSVINYKNSLLHRAWEHFREKAAPSLVPLFDDYCQRNASWLNDFSLFMALKDAHKGAHWTKWGDPIVLRKSAALDEARRKLAFGIGQYKFGQFLFSRQWGALRQYAHERGIRIFGDAPIFVSSDSSDVWANPELFLLDRKRQPTVVAGVPPDYFSPTGQLWGNPHYNWDTLKKTGYAWWIARLRATLEQVDLVRLDHFRGFEAVWAVPAGEATAEKGKWVKAPGAELLTALRTALGGLPIVAEDLGLITPEVEILRDRFDLPGMRILHFAFSGPDNRFLPHHHRPNAVVYPGTHDNDTTVGWYETLPGHDREFLHRYDPGLRGDDIAWGLIRMAWRSTGDFALVAAQDMLGLPSPARMNFPGRGTNNWGWRLTPGQMNQQVWDRLAEVTWLYDRQR